MKQNQNHSYGVRLLKIGLGLSLILGAGTFPVKAERLDNVLGENSPVMIKEENPQREIVEVRRRSSFRRYCTRPKLRIRARNIRVERIYRYSIYCRKKVLHGWQLWQRNYRRNNRLRVSLYDRRGSLLEKRTLRFRKYGRRGNIGGVRLFVTPEVGAVKIERLNSHRDNFRYERQNRRESDDYDDDD